MNKVVVILIVAVMSVSAFGAGFIGTPTAELQQGQWNVGFNYTYISTDLAKTKMTGLYDGVPESFKLEINDNNVQRYYAAVGYGITDAWEAYFQLGIADVKFQVKSDDCAGYNFDNDFAWGWGTRYTFHEQDNIRWGASLQMNWLDTGWDDKGTDYKTQIDYETYDLLIAVGPTVDMGGWNLYGGPFYYYLSGDLDLSGMETDEGVPVNFKYSGDLEEDSNIGGFVGAQLTLMENYDVTTELSFTGDGWALGAGIAVPF